MPDGSLVTARDYPARPTGLGQADALGAEARNHRWPVRVCPGTSARRYRRKMLLAVERVVALRKVELFSNTPGRVLAGLAHVLEEVEFAVGEELMTAGTVEDWLFVVVDGEVEVVRADRWIRLGPGSVVGEMGVIDPQPRSATIVALTRVR